jgi:glutamate racemase
MNGSAPIGVFDSGVGGLSVLRDIRAALPRERLIYIADSGHVPYGSKTPEYIRDRSARLTRFLLAHGAKAIVIACNTATAAAAASLRAAFAVPIVGMEPAVKPAAAATKNGVIGVLATVGTLRSARYAALLDRFGDGIEVVTQPCPGLADQIEAGDLDGPATRAMIELYTAPLVARRADAIVLGCTHYPFVRPLIADVALIDTGAAVARRLSHMLAERSLLNSAAAPGTAAFWTSGDVDVATRVMSVLWHNAVAVQLLPQDVR